MSKHKFIFLTVEFCIYLCFLFMDLFSLGNNSWIKYTGILLCVCYAICHANDKNGYLIAAALVFTAAADFFLLILNQGYLYGILLFIPVQILYMVKLLSISRQAMIPEMLLRIALPLLLALVLKHLHLLAPLTVLTGIYFSNLCINTIKSILCLGLQSFSVGLLLFLCCDLCIGLRMIAPGQSFAFDFFNIGIWAFYLPSQVLITIDKGDSLHVIKN